jgi:thiamine-monophosphate kinase
MREETLIRALVERFPRAPGQRNAPFTSDAEIVSLGDRTLALTVDEFSGEDGLSAAAPWPLGWNLVVATISDLLAVGAAPRWFLDAFVAPPETDEAWAGAFAEGMREALDLAGARLLGGDVGTADDWRFTGVALGEVTGRPVTRIPSIEHGVIVSTGRFGDGNLAAIAGTSPHFECRIEESRALAGVAAACIDTSDGLASALATVAALSPDLVLEIDLGRIAFDGGVVAAADRLDLPAAAFLLGGAGEYELLALVPEDAVPDLESVRRIGTFRRAAVGGVAWRLADGRTVDQPPLPDPRAAERDEYRNRVAELAVSMFGRGDAG